MSLVVRTLLREPFLARPFSRAFRRLGDDLWLDELPTKRIRRAFPERLESPVAFMEDMNRQMAAAMNRMQEFAEDLDAMLHDGSDSSANNENHGQLRRRGRPKSIVKRTESGGLQLALDVADYKPEDLKIRLIQGNLVVEASSEISGENSYHKREFKKWFKLPEGCKLEEIKSKLTEDNRLLIDLPTDRPEADRKARTIPIEMNPKQTIEANDQQQKEQNNQEAATAAS